jgi:hypothetical protein
MTGEVPKKSTREEQGPLLPVLANPSLENKEDSVMLARFESGRFRCQGVSLFTCCDSGAASNLPWFGEEPAGIPSL